jgi:hypothetical protein
MIPAMPPTKRSEPTPDRSLKSKLVALPGMIAGKLKSAPREVSTAIRHIALPWLRARRLGRRLDHLAGAAAPASASGVVVVSPFYGNHVLLASFLEHHRGLGIGEFVFLDLSADGRLAQHLAFEIGCTVWRPRGELHPGHAIYLLNYLRGRYATGRWCLSLDPGDMFVFHRSESRKIRDLIEFIESEGRGHIHATVVEMYGDRPAAVLDLKPGERPLDALPYFDPSGYTTVADDGPYESIALQGGAQRRGMFAREPRQSPMLNRVPLVKWGRFHAYLAGTHLLTPYRLNAPHYWYHTTPTACLLRFALLDDDTVLASAAKAEAGAIIPERPAPSYAAVAAMRWVQLKRDFSVRFTSSADLVACGLLNVGQWF